MAALESSVAAAAFALETARSLAEAHRRGEQLPAVTIAETLALIERRQVQVENLREGCARFKSTFPAPTSSTALRLLSQRSARHRLPRKEQDFMEQKCDRCGSEMTRVRKIARPRVPGQNTAYVYPDLWKCTNPDCDRIIER